MLCLLIICWFHCLLKGIVQKQRTAVAYVSYAPRDPRNLETKKPPGEAKTQQQMEPEFNLGPATLDMDRTRMEPSGETTCQLETQLKSHLRGCSTLSPSNSPDRRSGDPEDAKTCKFHPLNMNCSSVVLEKMISKRDREIIFLREEVHRLQLTLEEVQESTASHISDLQQQLANKMKDIEILEARLLSQQDYERIKSELRILRERKLASTQSHLLAFPASDTAEVPTQSPQAEKVSPSLAGVEIKRETETPSDFLPPTESLAHMNEHSTSSRRTEPLACQQTPSCLSSNDDLAIKSENLSEDSGLLPVNASRDVWSDWSSDAEGSFLESIENQIETAEITQQVKELLKKHNISQRVFGHYVLGRLQGTISELLGHPKPWNKLTARGKEPFLRMIHFLSDEQNVLVLRLIQDKLQGSVSLGIHKPEMRSDVSIRNILEEAKRELQSQNGDNSTRIEQTQIRNNGTHDDSGVARESEDIISSILEQARHEMQVQKNTEEQGGTSDLQVKRKRERRKSKDQQTEDHDLCNAVSNTDFVQNIIRKVIREIDAEGSSSTSCEAQSWLRPRSSTGSCPSAQGYQFSPFSDASPKHSVSRKADKGLSAHVGFKFSQETEHVGRPIHPDQPASESYKENWQPPESQDGPNCEGSLTQPLPDLHSGLEEQQQNHQFLQLDTLSITRKVKQILSANNLGQRLFGERVLGMTQGSVSDLLARPKPWTELSLRGREPFIRMYLWLKDPQNVHRLKAMKSTGHRAYWKEPLTCLSTGSDGASQKVLLDTTDPGFPDLDLPGAYKMVKRPRVVLTSREKEVLNKAYRLEPYPSHYTTQRLALQLGLEPCTVTNWFYNHRSRLRYSVEDGPSAPTQFIHSPTPDPDMTQSHSQDCANMDTCLTAIKQEPGDIKISDVRTQVWDGSHSPEYVSTGTQPCIKVKVEMEEDVTASSLQPEDEYPFL